MSITSIISAIGNNSSIYPLLIRDCCIEAPSKILIARKENLKESKEIAKDATREKFIDEYLTSAIWLGGIPFVEVLSDKFITKKGFNPNVNIKLFKEVTNLKDKAVQGIDFNINKFKNFDQKEVKQATEDLIKVKNNKMVYEKLLTKKFCAATIIPTLVMGFIIPPLNFALTRQIRKKKEIIPEKSLSRQNVLNFTSQKESKLGQIIYSSDKNCPSFTGNLVSSIANLRTVDKMAISDGGLTIGRVTTSRNKEEAYVNAFRMIGSMILNFVTPVYIAKGLDFLANKAFNINVNLDPLILNDKEFIYKIKNNKVELPKSNSAEDIITFIDEKPLSKFCKFAAKMKKVSYLDCGIRDPRKYVDVDDLRNYKIEFEKFINQAKKSKNIENFANKAKVIKSINILSNVAISSFLLAGVLPKLQYQFNKFVTGSYLDPGLK